MLSTAVRTLALSLALVGCNPPEPPKTEPTPSPAEAKTDAAATDDAAAAADGAEAGDPTAPPTDEEPVVAPPSDDEATVVTPPPENEEPVVTPPSESSIPNAQHSKAGLTTGGQPSEEQLKALAKEGTKTVVNLRAEVLAFDEAALVKSLGMAYHSIPVQGADGLTPANVDALDKLLKDSANYPIVVHCKSGNRVGALFALIAHNDGLSPDQAIEAGRRTGLTSLESTVKTLIGK